MDPVKNFQGSGTMILQLSRRTGVGFASARAIGMRRVHFAETIQIADFFEIS